MMNRERQISVDFLVFLVFTVGVAGCSKSTDSNVPINEPPRERVLVSGPITEDAVWESGKEYYVTGDIVVEQGATLTIQPACCRQAGCGGQV